MKQSIKANGLLWLATTIIVVIIIAILKIVMATSSAATFTVNTEKLAPYIVALWKSGLSIGGLTSSLGLSEDFLQNMQGMNVNLVMNNMFYNLAGVLVPIIYAVIVANNLMANQVDKGSMAFILSTPTKRSTVAFTQSVFLISSLFIMFIITALVDIAVSYAVGLTVDVGGIFLLNLGLFLVMLAISGMCFMFASIYNLTKYSLAWGGGLGTLFYINKVLGMFGDPNFVNAGMGFAKMKIFDYMSIITLLDTSSIYDHTTTFIWKFAILAVVGIITYVVGNVVFCKKDLPL